MIANRPRHAGVYSLLYRLRHGFDRDRIGWEDHQASTSGADTLVHLDLTARPRPALAD